jgi:putative ABC transport system permease protein
VLVEGILIGIISWVIGGALAVPLSQGMGEVVGQTMVRSSLRYTFSLEGLALWLGVVVVLAGLASLLPARRASKLSVREVLAYE